STIRDLTMWHVWEEGTYLYPSENVVFDGYIVRGDPRCLANPNDGGFGWRSGDYWVGNTTIKHADVQGMYWGIGNSTNLNGTFTVRDSYFRNYLVDISLDTLASPGARAPILGRTVVINNVRFDPYPGAPQ